MSGNWCRECCRKCCRTVRAFAAGEPAVAVLPFGRRLEVSAICTGYHRPHPHVMERGVVLLVRWEPQRKPWWRPLTVICSWYDSPVKVCPNGPRTT